MYSDSSDLVDLRWSSRASGMSRFVIEVLSTV